MYAILRSYNNPAVFGLIERMNAFIDHFIVVVHAEADTLGTIEKLNRMSCAGKIISIPLRPYGWSRALNAGIEALPADSRTVLMISNEVHLDRAQFERMRDQALENEVSCSYVSFEGRSEFVYQLPRNTCCVWNTRVFKDFGNFDLRLDAFDGMEDVELAFRAFVRGGLVPKKAGSAILEIRPGTDIKEKAEKEMENVRFIENMYPQDRIRDFYERLGVL